jgi:hypothetical protein
MLTIVGITVMEATVMEATVMEASVMEASVTEAGGITAGGITITILKLQSTGTRSTTRASMCLLMILTLTLLSSRTTSTTLVTMKLSTMVQVVRSRHYLMAGVLHHAQQVRFCLRTGQFGCLQSVSDHHDARLGLRCQQQHCQHLEGLVVHHPCQQQKLLQRCAVQRKRP